MQRWNVRRVLAPVLLPCHVFGVTLLYGKRGRLLGHVHRLLVLGLCVLVFVHEIPSQIYWLEHSEGLHAVIVKLELTTRWISFFGSFLLTALKDDKINGIVDGLRDRTRPLPPGVQSRIFRLHVAHVLFNAVGLAVYNVLGHDVTWSNVNYRFYTSFLYILVDLMIFLCLFQFIQLVNLMCERFKEINSKMKGIKKSFGQGHPPRTLCQAGDVVGLREMHLFLCRTCTELNSCYTYQLLCMLCYVMVQVIYAIRAVVGDFSITDVEERSINLVADMAWLLPFVFILIQMIVFCERTAAEGRRTIVAVHHLMNVYYCDGDILTELEIFALQVNQHPITFNVKFFDLDYPFFNTMISSMVTYLIIIVTFQGETDSGTIKDWNFKPPTTTEVPEWRTTEASA